MTIRTLLASAVLPLAFVACGGSQPAADAPAGASAAPSAEAPAADAPAADAPAAADGADAAATEKTEEAK